MCSAPCAGITSAPAQPGNAANRPYPYGNSSNPAYRPGYAYHEQTARERIPHVGVEEDMYINDNVPYYKRKFGEIRSSRSAANWNWSAFLFPPYWCIYRKMYGLGAGIAAGLAVTYWLGLYGGMMVFPGCIIFGLYANNIYMRRIEQLVAGGCNLQGLEKRRHVIKYGGVNTTAAVLSCIAYTVLVAAISTLL